MYQPYLDRAKGLAQFMTSYKLDSDNHFLARNAYAIAMGAGFTLPRSYRH